MSRGEADFVGAGRLAIVEGLMTVFDRVCTDDVPAWVILEAPSGWGKTRVVREFYERLANERQAGEHYWPPSILESLDYDLDDLGSQRKRVNPRVVHTPGSLPPFMWWGISCYSRNGIPSIALAEDLRVLQAHAPYLEDAWRLRAPKSGRFKRGVADIGFALFDEVLNEAGDRLAEEILNTTVPGLGLVRWLAERGIDLARARHQRVDRLASNREIAAPSRDLVEEVSKLISRLAIPSLPVVVFVEDLQATDDLLPELLRTLTLQQGSVMIITTSWPGTIEANPSLARALAQSQGRTFYLNSDMSQPPSPFPRAASLERLSDADLASIARFELPQAAPETIRQIASRYPNPLALRLFCSIEWVREKASERPSSLSELDIASAPEDVVSLHREIWKCLPRDVRKALTLAALSVPHNFSASRIDSARWNVALLARATQYMQPPILIHLGNVLRGDGRVRGWVRNLGASLQAFHELEQLQVAGSDNHFFQLEKTTSELGMALAKVIEERVTAADSDFSSDEHLHMAELASALHKKGFLTDASIFIAAVLPALAILYELGQDPWRVIEIADQAVDAAVDVSQVLDVLLIRADAHLEVGHPGAASLDAQLCLRGGLRGRRALVARKIMGLAMEDLGDFDGAIVILGSLANHWVDVLGPTDESSLAARNDVALALHSAGRVQESLSEFQLLVPIWTELYGSRYPSTLTARNNLGLALWSAGQNDEASEVFEELVRDRIREQGWEHPHTLTAVNNLALTLQASGRENEALRYFEGLLPAWSKVQGKDHPDTLIARSNYVEALARTGQKGLALEYSDSLLSDNERIFGPDDPHTLTVRMSRSLLFAEPGDVNKSILLLEELLVDLDRLFEPGNRLQQQARFHCALLLGQAGKVGAAVDLLASILPDMEHSMGPDHPDIAVVRRLLAFWRRSLES